MMVMVWGNDDDCNDDDCNDDDCNDDDCNDDDRNDDDHDEVGLPWGWIEKVHGCPLWPSLDTPKQARSPT